MKRGTSRRVPCKRDNSLFLRYILISPDVQGLTFCQSYILPLFFSGLLSYLVGMKSRTSRHVACKRDSSLSLLCTYLPRCPRFTIWLTFFQSYMLPLFFNGLLSYLVGKEEDRRHVMCMRDNSHFLHYELISLEAKILCRP